MKIISTRVIPMSEVPQRIVNTEFSQLVAEIERQLKSVPDGQSRMFQLDKLAKYHRYAIQKRLQNLGHSVHVSQDLDKKQIFVFKVKAKEKK